MRNLHSFRFFYARGQSVGPILESSTQFVRAELQLRAMRPLFVVEENTAEVVYDLIQLTQSVKQTVRVRLDAFPLEWVRTP